MTVGGGDMDMEKFVLKTFKTNFFFNKTNII